jgi:hypothetical protein
MYRQYNQIPYLFALLFFQLWFFLFDASAIAEELDNTEQLIQNHISISKPPGKSQIIFESILCDPEGNSVAYVSRNEGGLNVVVNETISPIYDSVSKGSFVFSKKKNRYGYVAIKNNKMFAVIDGRHERPYEAVANIVFSPDGLQVVYHAKTGNDHFIVHNNREGQRYDGIFKVTGIIYSSDSRNFAYVGLNKKKMVLVVNEREQQTCNAIYEVLFSPDSNHIAYIARHGKKYYVIRDGEKSKGYDRIANLSFSPDSNSLAYVVMENGNWFVIKDSKKFPSGTMAGIPSFSPDSIHFAYALMRGGIWNVIVDNVEGPSFDRPGRFRFSPDSLHFAYTIFKNGNWYMVTDKGLEKAFDRISEFFFSSDGNRISYNGYRDEKWFNVTDGQESNSYDWIELPIFSLNSKHVAFAARKGDKGFMVVDGQERAHYDLVGQPVYSPDNVHLVYTAKKNDNWFFVLDEKPGDKTYDGFLNSAPVVFDSNRRFHSIAFRMPGPEFLKVVADIF